MLTIGNSDLESNLTPKQIIELDQLNPYSLTTSFTPDESTNYYTIISANTKVILIIFMIDSTGWYCSQYQFNTPQECGVSIQTVKWVDTTLANVLSHSPFAKAFIFMHNPLHESVYGYHNGGKGHLFGDFVSCPDLNSGLFNVIKK